MLFSSPPYITVAQVLLEIRLYTKVNKHISEQPGTSLVTIINEKVSSPQDGRQFIGPDSVIL